MEIPQAQTATVGETRVDGDQVGRDWRPHGTTPDSLIETLTALSGRCLALKARIRELADEVKQLHAERRYLRSQRAAVGNLQPLQASRPARARTFLDGEECRHLERDLHDSVQNELEALIVKLRLARQGRDKPARARPDARCAEGSRRGDSRLRARHCPRVHRSSLAKVGVREALRADGAGIESTDA